MNPPPVNAQTKTCTGECMPKVRYAYTDLQGNQHIAFTSGWAGAVAQIFEAVMPLQAQPVASTVPTNLNFGNQSVGTASVPQTITLSNTGGGPLTISNLTITGDFSTTTP